MINRKYGNYKLIKLLGKGGYGEVHLAIKDLDNQEYAIKIIDKNKIIEENLGDSIKTEIHLMKIIKHPFIVKLIEVMATQQKILLVMEYLEGGDLFDAIKAEPNSKMSEEKSRYYFQQIILAIEYCHKLKIIHRDLKPENILVDKKNNCIKVSDFGLSTCIKSNDELLQDTAGTTNYLAPEVIKQTGYLGQSADIWSAGVILFNCVTGTFPFYSSESRILLDNILTANVTYPKYLTKNLVDLFKNIFVVNAKKRYNCEQIKNHIWFKTNLSPVTDYLKLNLPEEIKFLEETYDLKEKESTIINRVSKTNVKGINVHFEDIPLINCFELGAMIAGNTIKNMFEKKSYLESISYDQKGSIFKFISYVFFDEACKLINNHLYKIGKDFLVVSLGNGKFLIDIIYKNNINLEIILQFFKINETKHLFSINFKQGSKLNFQIFIKSIFDNFKNIFIEF